MPRGPRSLRTGICPLARHEYGWRLVQCGRIFISDTKSRYMMIELECLAASWAMRKCNVYLAGISFTLVTDHQPFVPIFNGYSLDRGKSQASVPFNEDTGIPVSTVLEKGVATCGCRCLVMCSSNRTKYRRSAAGGSLCCAENELLVDNFLRILTGYSFFQNFPAHQSQCWYICKMFRSDIKKRQPKMNRDTGLEHPQTWHSIL